MIPFNLSEQHGDWLALLLFQANSNFNEGFCTSAHFHTLSLPTRSVTTTQLELRPTTLALYVGFLIPKNILGTLFSLVAPILEEISGKIWCEKEESDL